jgi:hypothetical protein
VLPLERERQRERQRERESALVQPLASGRKKGAPIVLSLQEVQRQGWRWLLRRLEQRDRQTKRQTAKQRLRQR